MKEYTQTCTASNDKPKGLTLEVLQEAFKAIGSAKEAQKIDKDLGLQAMNCKYNYPETYRMFSDEDKLLIDNAIERRAYIIRQEGLILPPLEKPQYNKGSSTYYHPNPIVWSNITNILTKAISKGMDEFKKNKDVKDK